MDSQGITYIRGLPELAPLLQNADHVDVKTVTGNVTMRTFLAAMLSYHPSWVTLLYRIRAVFVRLLGMRQQKMPFASPLTPEEVPMQVGEKAAFFRIRMVKEEHHWIAGIDDTHLNAILGVVLEPLPGQQKRFHVLTIVHYQNWAGPVYFGVIRPFHHLVVASMAHAGIYARS